MFDFQRNEKANRQPMETLLICLLLLYNAWLVSYILSGKRYKDAPAAAERPPVKPPRRDDGIVGKSLFKMEVKAPQATIPEPQAAKPDEGEDVTDIALLLPTERTKRLRHACPMTSWTKPLPTSASPMFPWSMRKARKKNKGRAGNMPPEPASRKSGRH